MEPGGALLIQIQDIGVVFRVVREGEEGESWAVGFGDGKSEESWPNSMI